MKIRRFCPASVLPLSGICPVFVLLLSGGILGAVLCEVEYISASLGRELLEFFYRDCRYGRTGVLIGIGSTDRKPGLVLTWLDKTEETLRGNRRQQGGQTVAGDRDHVGGKRDLNAGIVALGVDKPEPGQGKDFPAKLNHERGGLRAFLG